MTDEVRNALLVFVGGVLVLIVADGSYLHYVRPGSGPLVLAAGLVILALAAADVVRDLRGRPVAGGHDGSGEHGGHGTGRTAWLMLLPVLTILLVAPPALGADAVGLAGDRAAPVASTPADEPLPPGDAPPLAVVDFVSRVAATPSGPGAAPNPLAARDVTLTGFLVPARAGGGTDLARLVISCCAADASPVRVHLDDPVDVLPGVGVGAGVVGAGAGAAGAADGGDWWVTVRGRLVAGTGTAADSFVPTLRLVRAASVPPAVPAYEY